MLNLGQLMLLSPVAWSRAVHDGGMPGWPWPLEMLKEPLARGAGRSWPPAGAGRAIRPCEGRDHRSPQST